MLDLERRTPEQKKTAESPVKDEKLLSELLDGYIRRNVRSDTKTSRLFT
jgi:hypothetical protein